MVQDYNVISTYIGVNSRHRVEEISSGNTTKRTLRYVSKLIFKEQQQSFQTRIIEPEKIVQMLASNDSDGLNYGYLECNLSNGEQKKIHLSLDSDSKGKTIEIKWGLQNNFSAGLKRYVYNNGSTDIIMNADVGYTDYYGKINDIQFFLYFDSLNTYDKAAYPEATTSDGDDIFTVISDIIDKDAGEILQGLLEIPILSDNPNVRVYDGFAKFNQLVQGSDNISVASLSYIPIKNATKIDLTRARDISVTTTVEYGLISITVNPYLDTECIAYYNNQTLDLVLVYLGDLETGINNVEIPFIIEDDPYGSGENSSIQIIASHSVNMSFNQGIGITQDTMSMAFEHSSDITLGQDEYEPLEVEYSVSMSFNIATAIVKDTITLDLSTIVDTTLGQDDYDTVEAIYEVDLNYTLATSITKDTITMGLNSQATVTLGDDYFEVIEASHKVNLSYVIATPISFGTVTIALESDVETYGVDWVTGGTAPTTSTVCQLIGDIGNIRCDEVITCEFIETDSYLSMTDESTSQPTCTDSATYTNCVDIGLGTYSCTVYTADLDVTYENCETCEEVEI
jgi:hypothetical protein